MAYSCRTAADKKEMFFILILLQITTVWDPMAAVLSSSRLSKADLPPSCQRQEADLTQLCIRCKVRHLQVTELCFRSERGWAASVPREQVGVKKARRLAAEAGVPLVAVHHMEAHALIARCAAACRNVPGGKPEVQSLKSTFCFPSHRM